MQNCEILQVKTTQKETIAEIGYNQTKIGAFHWFDSDTEETLEDDYFCWETPDKEKQFKSCWQGQFDSAQDYIEELLRLLALKKKLGRCPKASPLKISTITAVCEFQKFNQETQLPLYIDLDIVNRHLELDDTVIRIKGKITRETETKKTKKLKPTKRNFYNQITVVIKLNPNETVNMKLFKNGGIQMTGLKHPDSIHQVMDIIRKRINAIKIQEEKEVKVNKHGLLTCCDQRIYKQTEKGFEMIGFYTCDKRNTSIASQNGVSDNSRKNLEETKIYIWNTKTNAYEYVTPCKASTDDPYSSMYLESGLYSTNYRKNVFNRKGDWIGFKKIIWDTDYPDLQKCLEWAKIQEKSIQTRSANGFKNKWVFTGNKVVDKHQKVVGHILRTCISTKRVLHQPTVTNPKLKLVAWKLAPSEYIKFKEPRICMINGTLRLNFVICKIPFNKILTNLQIENTFGVNGYQGINIKFYYNDKKERQDGVCGCAKKQCVFCQHEMKHKFTCSICPWLIERTGQPCDNCRNCKMCLHQEDCTDSSCNLCECTCDPCNCQRISILAFETGSVIISGAVSLKQIHVAYEWLVKVTNQYYYQICSEKN